MKILISVMLMISMLSCKNHKNATSTQQDPAPAGRTSTTETVSAVPGETKPDTNKTTKYNPAVSRLVVLFHSIGEGIEYKLMNEYIDSVDNYSNQLGKKINFKKAPWGREGETDICFPLNELSAPEQDAFVAWTKEFLKKGKWVNIHENYTCPSRRIR